MNSSMLNCKEDSMLTNAATIRVGSNAHMYDGVGSGGQALAIACMVAVTSCSCTC